MRILTRTWQPALYGPAAQPARTAVLGLADALRGPAGWAPPGTSGSEREVVGATLASGSAGIAVFYSYLAEATGDDEYLKLAVSHLDRAMEAVGTLRMSPSLFAGFPGVAWAVQHLHQRHELSSEDPLDDIDTAIRGFLSGPGPFAEFDLIGGLVGLGVYALERAPRPTAMELLKLVVDRLAETVERVTPGGAWPSPPPRPGDAQPGGGRYNLGLAHGQPGVISFLAQAWLVEPSLRFRAEGLLARSVAYLLSNQLPGTNGRRFPYSSGAGSSQAPARCAWCYGDLGVAAALLRAGRCLGEPSWERAAIDLARGASRLSQLETQVTDAGLCHGAIGLAHLFNRLWQETGDETLQGAATRWLGIALGMRREDQGVAGFTADTYDDSVGDLVPSPDPGLLGGGAGVGLALLAATTDVEPDWDRVLLLSGPGSSR
jgi:lantibiotic modifying enzyme